jgi:hypothetical protein
METVGIAQDGRPLFLTGVLQDCANVGTRMIVEIAASGHEYLAMSRNNLFLFFRLDRAGGMDIKLSLRFLQVLEKQHNALSTRFSTDIRPSK